MPTPSPTGQFVSLFGSSRVVMQRPDKLFVEARGDLFPSDTFYDGKTVTVVGADRRFYTRRDAAGGAIEALMQSVQPGSDATAPFLDLLVAGPVRLPHQGLHQRLLGRPVDPSAASRPSTWPSPRRGSTGRSGSAPPTSCRG